MPQSSIDSVLLKISPLPEPTHTSNTDTITSQPVINKSFTTDCSPYTD